jgi:hypothetical protein
LTDSSTEYQKLMGNNQWDVLIQSGPMGTGTPTW